MSGAAYDNGNGQSGQIVHQPPANPFQRSGLASHVAAGTVAIEQERAIAEAQGKLVVAKRFPRDEARAFARAMDSCNRPSLARVANYAFPRAGQTVSGPSIRLAEELARCWGNIDYGLRELSRRDGESEMEAYAWDLETNVMSSQKFTARHLRDKKGGPEALRDERDIYELTANLGARRLRARILAILPPDFVDAAVAQCRLTATGDNTKPIADQARDMTQAFAKLGVAADLIAARLGHPLDAINPDELADLREIYASIKDGVSKVGDWFGIKPETPAQRPASKLEALESQAPPVAPAPAAADAPAPPAEDDGLAAAPDPLMDWTADFVGQIIAAPTVHAIKALANNAAVKAKVAQIKTERPALYDQIIKETEERQAALKQQAEAAAQEIAPGVEITGERYLGA